MGSRKTFPSKMQMFSWSRGVQHLDSSTRTPLAALDFSTWTAPLISTVREAEPGKRAGSDVCLNGFC